jgi:KTSC domain
MATPRFPIATVAVVVMLVWSWATANAAEPARIASHIRREPIVSRALAAAGYSKRLHILEIEFCNGAIYRYLDVPGDVYRDFLSADSKTQFYDWNIKGHYRSFRLRAAGPEVARR